MPVTQAQLTQMLFSFEGRMRRRDFWLCALALALAQWVLQSIISMMFFPFAPMAVSVYRDGYYSYWTGWWSHVGPSFGLIGLLLLWPRLAIGVKRCHDRDKSGWWLLLSFIPVIGWIWLLIEFGFLDGTPGPNKYGPSPKALEDASAA